MGDIRVLQEQIEIGVPLESAAILAGYEFEEIAELAEDAGVRKLVAIAHATLMSRHLMNIGEQSDNSARLSTWILEHLFPDQFGTKLRTKDETPPPTVPTTIILKGANDE